MDFPLMLVNLLVNLVKKPSIPAGKCFSKGSSHQPRETRIEE